MFGFFKRPKPVTPKLDGAMLDAMFDEMDTDEERRFDRVSAYTRKLCNTLQVDLGNRQLIWKDGTRLNITELAERINKKKPEMHQDDIDFCITNWLQEEYGPEDVTMEEMDNLQLEIEDWIEAHQGETASA